MEDLPKKPQVVNKSLVEALMGAIVDGIITINKQGAIQTVNPASEKIFGYAAAELIGKNIKVLMPEPFQSEHDGYLKNYLTTGIKKIIGTGREVIGKRKNGECFPLELAISDMEVDGQTMFAGIIRDISERKEVESALIASNNRLALATEAGGIGVWEYDLVSGNLVWDDRMFDMYDVDKKKFSGLYEAWRNRLHPEDLAEAEALFNNSVEHGVPFDTCFKIIKSNNVVRYIDAHAQVIKNEQGEVQQIIGVNLDVTEAKQVALEYQARENRIRALMDTIVDGIIVINKMGGIISMNPAAESLFGYSQQELEGKNIKMLMPEPYSSAHDKYLSNYRTTGVKKIIGSGREVLGLRRDGSTFPMELAVSEAEANGETLFTGIVRDISERKAVLDQLRLQSGALEAAANAILITNYEGVIQWVNSAFTRLTGYSHEEVYGKSTRMLKSGEQPPNFFRELWSTVKEGRVWHGEMVNKRRDGSLYTEEQTITPVVDSRGEITHYIAIKLDISERKKAEAELAEKTRALATVAEFERTHSRVMALFNSYSDTGELFSQMLHLLAESHQMHISAVFLVDEWHGHLKCVASYGLPDSVDREITLGKGFIGQAAMSDKTLIICEPEDMPLKIDVGLFDVSPTMILALPIAYLGKTLGVLVLASVKVLSENEIGFLERLANKVGISLNNQIQYQHLKALSEQLKQRGKEISQKNALLERNNKLKTEFLANMSHELRTPLNAIIGFSEVLKDELLGTLNDEQSDYVGEVYDSANHLLSLINDILDLSKIEAGKMDLVLDSINIPETITNSISIIKEKAHNHRIQIQLNIGSEVSFVRVDSRKFKQILFNLLSNAVKFTPDGGLIKIDAARDKGMLVVAISDTGIGIPEKEISMLFQPFVQLDGSLSRQYEGTGLGLAMVRRLVELHEGTVSVTSKEGQGSCFVFSIPYLTVDGLDDASVNDDHDSEPTLSDELENAQSAVDEARHKPLLSPTIKKVLIIESDSATGESFAQQLSSEGYSVFQAQDEAAALQSAMTNKPDLIVLDLMIPDAEGWSLIKKIKQHESLKDIPVASVAISSAKGIPLGMVDVLEKPILKDILLDAVAKKLPDIERGRVTILVVDDEHQALRFLTEQLEGAGFKTLAAYNGQHALELLESSKPDLMVLDLLMPGISGFEVIAQLRQIESIRHTPVIILTAKRLTEQERLTLDENVHQVVEKCGFNTDSFVALIEQNLLPDNQLLKRYETQCEPPSEPTSEISSEPLILVIEENRKQADLLYLYLTDAGYRVKLAADGETGLELMQQERPDLITLNPLMSESSSTEFIEQKNQQPEYTDIPVMALSGELSSFGSAPISADAVLSKPMQRPEMLLLVKKLLPDNSEALGLKQRILLIDDDPKAIKIVSSYLAGNEFEIVTALSGADGIEIVESDPPDLIILDLMMPEMNGFEVLSVLKKSNVSADIPVIVLTAKLLTSAEKKQLSEQVAAISEKGNTNKQTLSMDVQRMLKRYRRS